MHIRARLLQLIAAILLPIFLAASVAVWFFYKEQREAEVAGIKEAVRTLGMLVDRDLLVTEGVLRTLANSGALRDGDYRRFYEYAKRVAPAEYATVVISEADGSQLLNTRRPFGSRLSQGNSGLVELRRRAGPQATLVSNLFVSRSDRQYSFAVQVPVEQNGRVERFLGMSLYARRLQPLLSQHTMPEGWIATVVDREGVVIARSHNAEAIVGRKVSEKLMARIKGKESTGLHQGVTLDGMPTVAYFSRAPVSGWMVVMSLPADQLSEPATMATGWLAIGMLAAIAVALTAAQYYVRRTAEPIERLRAAADSLGKGGEVAFASTGLVETDLVGTALTDASRRIREQQQTLEQRVAEAVAAAEHAQRALLQGQKLEALGRLTAGIAHDFNNILQTLSSALELIQLTTDRERLLALARTCEKAVARATRLTNQMRAFGRVQEVRPETIAASVALHNAMPMLEGALPSNIRWTADVPDQLWSITVDFLQFELALLNVVINARDAMPDGGALTLTAQNQAGVKAPELAAGDYVSIRIEDCGIGMSPETLARAMEPFFTTKAVDKGSGLGLAQAYGFAKQANGVLLMSSEEGRGTTVTMLLPRSRGSAAAAAGGHGAPASAAIGAADKAGTLLYVEDDALVRETVLPALVFAGFDVTAVENGEQALAALDAGQTFSRVFSDIVMPGQVSGIDLARIVRERFPHVPVLLATGYTDRKVDLPGVRLLAKPYDIMQAISMLRGEI
ncbi:hybrid sensor histidine kinase/response regulator [Massilia sp. SM-13]|uniref:hybrid sensor histidine kinase/response regulator n=1 Tax=Pseudoduganella rhizocola TaxID=3382643 RepID=UPI0038B45B6A